MVVMHDAAMLAVSAIIGSTSAQKRRCRTNLSAAVDRLERKLPRTTRADRVTSDAAQCIRTACVACGKCPGI